MHLGCFNINEPHAVVTDSSSDEELPALSTILGDTLPLVIDVVFYFGGVSGIVLCQCCNKNWTVCGKDGTTTIFHAVDKQSVQMADLQFYTCFPKKLVIVFRNKMFKGVLL